MSAPLIAVAGRIGAPGKVSRIEVSWAGRRYLDAVLRAHGEPVTLAPRELSDAAAEELLARFDGLMLMGGADVDPALYGQDAHETVYGVDRRNDEFEIALARAAGNLQVPTLAICRGMQVANVAFGGTLHQHIGDDPELVAHGPAEFPKPPEGVLHAIDVEGGSRLAKALEGFDEVHGASYHHQAVDTVAPGFRVTAVAGDGTVEAIEHDSGWFVCVQWHPEDTAAVDPAQQALFDAFVQAAGSR